MNKNLFAPSASFTAKCSAMNKRTNEIDAELDAVIVDLKLVVADTLKKLTRIEKLNIVQKAVA